MSEYRDDMNDTAFASEGVWARVRSLGESTAWVRDVILSGIVVMAADAAVASDEVFDTARSITVERAVASDDVLMQAVARHVLVDGAKVHDATLHRLRTVVIDGAQASETPADVLRAMCADGASVGDQLLGVRLARSTVSDTAMVADGVVSQFSALVADAAVAADALLGRAVSMGLVQDSVEASALILDAVSPVVVAQEDAATASAQVFDTLRAKDCVDDAVVAGWDEQLGSGPLLGQAWTAEAGSWAMSRYAPFGVMGLAVIDGKLHAIAQDGVYVLDGYDEQMQAQVRTGKLAMTKGGLCMPTESRIEYELDGTAALGVTTTQSGKGKTYTYPLKGRPVADELTNARFELGRGLLGRTFAFTLTLNGTHAYVNDWTITALPSKRSL